MDEILLALSQSLAHAGPEYVFAFGAIALVALKLMPMIEADRKSQREIEARREDRKAEEAKRREEHDREMVELNGRWLVVSEQSTEAMRAMSAQMEVLNATLADSKERSRALGEKVDDIHEAVVPHERKWDRK